MTSRERIKAAIAFEAPDRLPCSEFFWDGTLERWREQGMPAGVPAEDFFGLDLCFMFLDASPGFPQRLVRQEGKYHVYEDRFGYTVRRPTGVGGSLEFLSHVTTDQSVWADVKKRLTLDPNPAAPARIDEASYFAHMDPYPGWAAAAEKYRRLQSTQRYMLFRAYGPWNATWRHRGMEDLLMDLATEPDWVRDMVETYQDLVLSILRKCLDLQMRPDGFIMFEDLGWRESMLIAPEAWRAVLRPCMERLGQFLNGQGIDFWIHSDGAIQPIIQDLVECGVRVLNPLETAAGLDVRDMRQQFGRRLAFYGNIAVKNILAPGDKMLEEIRAKAPLACGGGYIFGSDHSIPPQVDLERYQQMLSAGRQAFAERSKAG